MQLLSLEIVESWHAAVNARDYDQLCALTSRDVELVGPGGVERGHGELRHWLGRIAFTAEPTRWFCATDGRVVVEQCGRWSTSSITAERTVASAFRVANGRVVRYERFDGLGEALATFALTDDDEVLQRS